MIEENRYLCHVIFICESGIHSCSLNTKFFYSTEHEYNYVQSEISKSHDTAKGILFAYIGI